MWHHFQGVGSKSAKQPLDGTLASSSSSDDVAVEATEELVAKNSPKKIQVKGGASHYDYCLNGFT